MKHDRPQFKLRLPPHLKSALEGHAAANDRTLTAEIVARLEASLAETGDGHSSKWDNPSDETLKLIHTTIQQTVQSLADSGWTPPKNLPAKKPD